MKDGSGREKEGEIIIKELFSRRWMRERRSIPLVSHSSPLERDTTPRKRGSGEREERGRRKREREGSSNMGGKLSVINRLGHISSLRLPMTGGRGAKGGLGAGRGK